ncbi:hypothetical protein [Labedella endophytica]|uniref:hypothetical protein n=1 Tax=Labedella endophytica TaxID=1523160 RepID=UPI0014093F2F|nr:hypothetical protein [Labedella endophytica]
MTTSDRVPGLLPVSSDRAATILGGTGVVIVCIASVALTLVSPLLAVMAAVLDRGTNRP